MGIENMNWPEIILALLSFANIWLNKSIREKILEMKLDIADKYMTMRDFERWTAAAQNLPTYKRNNQHERS